METGYNSFDNTPSREVSNFSSVSLQDFEIDEVFGDVIIVKKVDETVTGELKRGNIVIPDTALGRNNQFYRFVEIIKKGPDTPPNLKIGDVAMLLNGTLTSQGSVSFKIGKNEFYVTNVRSLFFTVKKKSEKN